MQKILYPGHKTKAPCEVCGRFVPATYNYGTVSLEDGTPVDDVMRATCDVCGAVLATAPQSAPKFRLAVEARAKARTQQTTVRISRVLADIARLALVGHHADPDRFDLVVKAYVMSLQGKRWTQAAQRLSTINDPALREPNDYLVPLYLNERLRELLEKLRRESCLPSLSELVRRILLVAPWDRKAEAELDKLSLVG